MTERAPPHLKRAGRALWRRILTVYELREDELTILASACRVADDLDRLEAELRRSPTLVAGSTGQLQPNRLFNEVRQGHLALSRLLAQLGLGELEDARVSRSSAGHRLAKLRWSSKHIISAVGE
jgi:hypothetical protein